MILGIGFIMIAAMFPVALSQTESSTQETVGSGMARSGVNSMQQMATLVWPGNPTTTLPYPTLDYSMLVPTFGKRTEDASVSSPPSRGVMTANYTNFIPPTSPVLTPGSGASMVIPGQVWSCFDSRDWYQQPAPTNTPHNAFMWGLISHNMINSTDPKFAWVALFKRDRLATAPAIGGPANPSITDSSSAQVIIFTTQVRNAPTYSLQVAGGIPSDVINPSQTATTYSASLQVMLSANAQLAVNPVNAANPITSTITIGDGSLAGRDIARAAEGMFVVISDDTLASTNSLHGLLNGHIYRLGVQPDPTGSPATWEFAPGYGLQGGDAAIFNAMALANARFYVMFIGRGRSADSPGSEAAPTFAGLAQDISVYSTFVQVTP
jgi:hypothetical protein